MSKADAVQRTIKAQQDIGFDMVRGGANVISDFLDDYMRIRFGMQPLDKPRSGFPRCGYCEQYTNRPCRGASAAERCELLRQSEDEWRSLQDGLAKAAQDDLPAVEIVVNGKPLHIYANGRITAPELAIGMIFNRIPALIRRAQQDALGPDWSPTTQAGGEESANRKHAADLHDWIERARDDARKSGSTDKLRIAMVQNVDTILAALREYVAGGWVNRPEAAELVNIGREALDERRHLMALDARDKLQGIMSGLPISTPHFHELNELLRKLDEICGSPVVLEPADQQAGTGKQSIGAAEYIKQQRAMQPEGEQWTLRERAVLSPAQLSAEPDAFDRASPEERQRIIDNMAIDWDTYRTPVELINHLNDLDGLIDDDAEHEMVEHVLAGRWSIVSHVPPRPALDPRPDHWKPHALVEEIRKAYAEEENGHSPLAGPVYELIQRLDQGDWVLSSVVVVAKEQPRG